MILGVALKHLQMLDKEVFSLQKIRNESIMRSSGNENYDKRQHEMNL